MTASMVRVKEVKPDRGWLLHVSFEDGKAGTFDMAPYLERPAFEPLKDIELFMSARVESGAVVWNDEIDIAPERLYSDIIM